MTPLSILALLGTIGSSLALDWSTVQRLAATKAVGQASSVQELEPTFFKELGAQRKKLKYGPYNVPAVNVSDGMKEFTEVNMALPCTDCYIIGFTADLEYPDGSNANANSSMWLHHSVAVNTARKDWTCPSQTMERVFAAGNERGTTDLTLNGTHKIGYYIGTKDHLVMVTELMNGAKVARDAVLALDFEYISAASASGEFKNAVALWIDITGACGAFTNGSEMAPPKFQNVFSLPIEPWTVPANFSGGQVRTVFSHLHDGGAVLQTTKNGQVVCEGVAKYGETPGYLDPEGGGMEGMDMSHISSMSWCNELGATKPGDVWAGSAHYNFTAHMPMMSKGQPAEIMGIAILFVEQTS